MEDLSKFKNKIFLHGIVVMLIMEVISLPFLGFNLKFSYGLLLGTAISIVNFNISAITMAWILNGKNKFLASLSYIIRLLIYGGVFYAAMKVAYIAGLGTVLGFLALKIAIYYLHGFKPKVRKGVNTKGGEINKEKNNILIKDPYMVRYCRGRVIITHRRFTEYKG